MDYPEEHGSFGALISRARYASSAESLAPVEWSVVVRGGQGPGAATLESLRGQATALLLGRTADLLAALQEGGWATVDLQAAGGWVEWELAGWTEAGRAVRLDLGKPLAHGGASDQPVNQFTEALICLGQATPR